MTNRKSQNSILFLTTLGVYLGLVLVGATPQVLAQAATTRNFDISEEVGQVDNLDKDPVKERRDRHSVSTKIRRSVSAFLADFSQIGLCETPSGVTERPRQVVSSCGIVSFAQRPVNFSFTTILSRQDLARASI